MEYLVDIEELSNYVNIEPLEAYNKCNYVYSNLWDEISTEYRLKILLIKAKASMKLYYYEEGIDCCTEAYKLVRNKKDLCEVYVLNALIETLVDNDIEAVSLNFKALKLAKELGDWKIIRRLYNNIGAIYLYYEAYDEAYEYYSKVEELDKAYGEEIKEGIAAFHESMAKIYLGKNEYNKALIEIDKMIIYSKKTSYTSDEAIGMLDKATILESGGHYREALELFNKARKILNSIHMYGQNYLMDIEEIKCYHGLGQTSLVKKSVKEQLEAISKGEEGDFYYQMKTILDVSPESIDESNIQGTLKAMIEEYTKFQENKKSFIIRSLKQIQNNEYLEEKSVNIQNKNRELETEKIEIEKINYNMRIISEIGKQINGLDNLESIIEILYKNLALLVDIDAIGIILVKNNSFNKAYFMKSGKRFIKEHLNTNVSSTLMKNKLDYFLCNSIEGNFSDVLIEMKSILFLPLIHDGETNGIVTIQNKSKNAFDQESLENMKEVSYFVAGAINNLNIKHELNNKIAKLEAELKSMNSL